MTTVAVAKASSLEAYLAEINKFPLLTREEEYELARKYRENNDLEAAQKLVTSNLRFVVKIAAEYRGLGFSFIDLIQEGNIGLMRAVKKFNPERGYRLISYAVWWIRAQIQNYILKSWSLVKMGTTQAQRKIFAKLKNTKRALTTPDGTEPDTVELAEALDVKPEEVSEMELRMAARDASLDVQLDEDSTTTHIDVLAEEGPTQEDLVAEREERRLLSEGINRAMKKLNEKERYILKNRVLSEKPLTLKEIGEQFDISRERVRQIEAGSIKKIRGYLAESNLVPV